MSAVFADSFYWIALSNRKDVAHARASQFAANHVGAMMTTEWVLTEVCDGLASSQKRNNVQRLRTLWRTDPDLLVVEASHEWFERGMDLFCSRTDKCWSLTDCISFLVMQEHGITEALTGDHHFEQAGFVALLR